MVCARISAPADHPQLQAARTVASELGARVLLVGGAVRDLIRTGALPDDLDLMVLGASAGPLARTLADRTDGRYVLLDEAFGSHRVVYPDTGLTVDLTDAQDDDLESDLHRRDLTLNAIAWDLEAGAYLDPLNGRRDLAEGRVRMVSVENLRDDPLRMLRVFRVAATVQARSFDPETLAVVQAHGPELLQSAPERIATEFFRLLQATPCMPYLQAMADAGLLEVILPELTACRAVPPNTHHHLPLFEHTLELVAQAEALFPTLPDWARETLGASVGGVERLALVKAACLLHDIGKPATWEIQPNGRHSFYGHDAVGEAMTAEVCRRLKTSRDRSEFLQFLVRWHLYPAQFGPDSPRKSVLRFFRRMGERTPDVLLLNMADRLSTQGPAFQPGDIDASMDRLRWLLDQYNAEQSVLTLPRLLSGHDLMSLLGLPPGPHLKVLLEAVAEAQQLGEVADRDAAAAWLQAHATAILTAAET